MKVRKLTISDAVMELSPGQDAEIYTGNLVDERHGGPVTIGYGRWGAQQTLDETMSVDDVMIVLDGQLSVSSHGETFTAARGDIVYMPKGQQVLIRAHDDGAVTAYVTYPHWKVAD